MRFIMAYNYNDHNPAYAQILAQVDDYRKIPALLKASEKYIAEHYPQAMAQALSFTEGVNIPFKVAARFRGADKKVLRKLADKAKDLFRQNGNVKYIRDDWGDDVKALRVKYAPLKGRGAMVSRGELTQALSWNFYGVTVGTFRDGKDLIPIVTRAVESERDSARALVGFLGLSGMLLKNAIVMLDQINTEQSSGKPVFQSIVDAGVSRLPPVSMGAGTTILGVVPLIAHAFYSSMAATIVFGLFVSTVLVLYTIPVFYAVLYRVKART